MDNISLFDDLKVKQELVESIQEIKDALNHPSLNEEQKMLRKKELVKKEEGLKLYLELLGFTTINYGLVYNF